MKLTRFPRGSFPPRFRFPYARGPPSPFSPDDVKNPNLEIELAPESPGRALRRKEKTMGIESFDDDPRPFLVGAFVGSALSFVVLAALAACCVGGLVHLVGYLDLVGQRAQIEQLRADLASLDVGENEDAVGQATVFNQDIRAWQAYNGHWWSDWAVPEEWNDIALLPLGGAR
jgi:hypothetical protein